MGSKSFPELISEIKTSVASLAKQSSGAESYALTEFSVFVEKLSSIMCEFKLIMDTPPIRKAIKSLETELKRALGLLITTTTTTTTTTTSSPNNNCRSPAPPVPPPTAKQIEEMTHDVGRSLGLVLFASSHDLSTDVKHKIEGLRKDMMNARFYYYSSDCESELLKDIETEEEDDDEDEDKEEEIVVVVDDNKITLDVDDIVLQLKYGNDDEFKCALSGLKVVIRDNMVTNEWINDEGVIPILFNRLGSSKPSNRLTIIQMITSLSSVNPENKEKMADVGSLSILVKSLMRDAEEQREAVGLLSSLSDLSPVRRRIGRIQGCIVMLVAIFNGDDPIASHYAGNLLNSLSGNTQNALHMAEAGYFKPLVHYLKEGSDMSKILMATALSRMELTDLSKASLGEDGAIEPLVKMFNLGKLEAKLSALSALQNLSSLKENIQRLISSGIVVNLLQLLFSVTSVLMTLREPASAILARIAQSESILVNQDVAQQMLSLLTLSSPVIQDHLLQALNSIAAHSSASSKVRRKLKENGAVQLLLPFLTEANAKIRASALNLIYTLSKDLLGELMEQLGETHLSIIVNIISSSVSDSEKAASIGILSNLPVSDKKATDILKRADLLPILISLMTSSAATSTPVSSLLAESIAGVLIRFTVPTDKKLQKFSAEQGVIPLLVKLLSIGSPVAKCRAATSLAQLSQNSVSLRKSRKSRWLCVPPSVDAFCDVHDGYCFVKSTFCLVKAGAVSSLVQILGGNEREADEAVLCALASLLEDEICENGSNCIAKMSGVQAIINVLESGSLKAQEKALWILERIFRVEAYSVEYGESARVVLIDLAQNGDPQLKPTIAKLLAQLDVLQFQSSYF